MPGLRITIFFTIIFTCPNAMYGLVHHTPHDVKVGERLFYGLIKTGNNTKSCSSCHNTSPINSFNWNPSALQIAELYKDKTSVDLKNALLNPNGKKMKEAHTGITLNNKQISQLKIYLDWVSKTGITHKKTVTFKIAILVFLFLMTVLVIIDLFITKRIKNKLVHSLATLFAISAILFLVRQEAIALGNQQNYEPDQPIKFSHNVHAGINGTDCLYCHHTAEDSKMAGIPSTNVCMNCHAVITEGTNSGKFEITKIHRAMEEHKPVRWIKVHNLPDYVFYSHAQHVSAGQLDCAECHGHVEERDKMRQEKELTMGWCLECHRTRSVQFTENNFYKTFEELQTKLKNNAIDSVLVKDIGGEDCMKCHY